MIMIDEARSSSNKAIRSDGYSPTYVELAVPTDERAVTDNNRRTGVPDSIELKLNSSLQSAAISDLDLMRPAHV